MPKYAEACTDRPCQGCGTTKQDYWGAACIVCPHCGHWMCKRCCDAHSTGGSWLVGKIVRCPACGQEWRMAKFYEKMV